MNIYYMSDLDPAEFNKGRLKRGVQRAKSILKSVARKAGKGALGGAISGAEKGAVGAYIAHIVAGASSSPDNGLQGAADAALRPNLKKIAVVGGIGGIVGGALGGVKGGASGLRGRKKTASPAQYSRSPPLANFRKAGSKNILHKLKKHKGLIAGAVLGSGALVIGNMPAKRFAALNKIKRAATGQRGGNPDRLSPSSQPVINVSSRRIN